MHNQAVRYKETVIMPVASLSDRGYAATAIVTRADGKQRALGPFGYRATEQAASEYALSCAKAYVDRLPVRRR